MNDPTSSSYPGSDPDDRPRDHGTDPATGEQPPAGGPPDYGQQPFPPYPQGPQQGPAGGWPAYPPPGAWQPPGQHPYGGPQPPYGYYPPGPGGPVPASHPQAGLALGLGLGGLLGGFLCGLPLLLSPFAWALGHRARRDIRASHGATGGDGMALAGMILGIIGSVLLALSVIALVIFAVVLISDSSSNV